MLRILHEYGSHSTIHGLGYIFDKDISLIERSLWLFTFLGVGFVAVNMTVDTFISWQDNQVITTLKNIDKSIVGMNFPAVTICQTGLHMGQVEDAFFNDFNDWKNADAERINAKDETGLIQQFLSDTFQIEAGSNINVMNIIDAMSPSDGGKSISARMVMQNLLTCSSEKLSSVVSK